VFVEGPQIFLEIILMPRFLNNWIYRSILKRIPHIYLRLHIPIMKKTENP